MTAVDTSVVVAAFASWHESHPEAVRVITEGPALLAAVALEYYAVLTRMPAPHRAERVIVRDFLRRAFPSDPLTLAPHQSARIIDDLVAIGVGGGASYDAVIAMTAAHHGHQLVTLDVRARSTFQRVGVDVRFLRRSRAVAPRTRSIGSVR